MSASQIQKFYSGKNVLVTGATGFVGKVIAQKLITSVPDIGKVYCLVRPGKNATAAERLRQMTLSSNLFERVRREEPHKLEKLVAVNGDMTSPGLALSADDRKRLTDEVNVVLHSAATINFNERLDVATELNIVGPKQILELSRDMKGIEAMAHVSTCYTNVDRTTEPEEKVYSSVDPETFIEDVRRLKKSDIAKKTPEILGTKPNTYTLTKSIAENLMTQQAGSVPAFIFRPSIVGATWKDHMRGWVDNKAALTGVLYSVAMGMNGGMRMNYDAKCDLIPVDVVSNMLIAGAWWRASSARTDVPVIHCASGHLNPIKWNEVMQSTIQHFQNQPLQSAYANVDFQPHMNEYTYLLSKYLKQYLPAYSRDAVDLLRGAKANSMKKVGFTYYAMEVVDYFTQRGWTFQTDNMLDMLEKMNAEDKELYNFDVRQIDWQQYLTDYFDGMRTHVCKETTSQPISQKTPILMPKPAVA